MPNIRFHLDENVNPKIASGMRLQGLDVTTTPESGLLKASDEIQFEFAQREGRVIITQDSDFLRIASRRPNHAGILFYSTRHTSIGEVVLETISLSHSGEEMRGVVRYI